MRGQAFVAGILVCESQLSASIIRKDEK
jgi:hypothetical protein